jgi:hypothetical protein
MSQKRNKIPQNSLYQLFNLFLQNGKYWEMVAVASCKFVSIPRAERITFVISLLVNKVSRGIDFGSVNGVFLGRRTRN